MHHRWNGARAHRRLALLLACILTTLSAGCGQTASPEDAPAAADLSAGRLASGATADASVASQLAQLRAVTAGFQRFDAADSAGYSTQITECMTDPVRGGMGFHYGKASAIDATVDLLEPEVLLYEPQSNGRLRLVAVEYIVPYDVQPRDGPAPTLFGRNFLQNDDFKLWGLHAWVWRNNPAGMFEDWNPDVDCDAVPAASRMTHPGQ